ncbi:MAG: CocE/NonD family hydrolase [bacterium]|nr:CocE/NonD family hydrolase [bacterium]
MKNVPAAVLTVGGWFDAEDLMGPFRIFRAVEASRSKGDNHLVMGPWSHGGWHWEDGDALGDVRFQARTSQYYRDEVLFPFFQHHLNRGDDPELPKALVFQTGTNQWQRYTQWPPPGARTQSLYFHARGGLSFDPPTAADGSSVESGSDSWVGDPARPVPFTEQIDTGVPEAYMVADQRFAGKRPDVLVYQTEPLTEDLVIAGPLRPQLWVSTTATDADFVVKLIDVYPDDFPDIEPNPTAVQMGGYQQLVRGEPMRAKFRNDLETPEPMVAAELTHLQFDMADVCHVFRRGHRLMVQVQSSWFPLVDRNPQTFVDIPNAAAEAFQPATHTLYHSITAASAISLMVLDPP